MTESSVDVDGEQFRCQAGELWCEGVRVADLAERYGTPLYIYSRAAIEQRFATIRAAFGPRAHICYAVKSSSNLHLLRLFAELGAGFDVVSGGELARLRAAGVAADQVVFAGVGKQEWEVQAAIDDRILFLNVESLHELSALEAVGARSGPVRLALRLNPDVDASTHDYISTGRNRDKFGLDLATAAEAVERIVASPALELVGYHVHLGSQLRSAEPFLAALDVVEEFLDAAAAHRDGVTFYDLGGGFGASYGEPDGVLDVGALAAAMLPRLAARGLVPVLEPGRYLVADAGILVTRVLGIKPRGERVFAVVDAAMNDLIRPALYQAEHPVVAVGDPGGAGARYDVVGPVCESGDFLALDRDLPELQRGDLLSVMSAGAYGMSMASNYNSRPRAAEVLVAGDSAVQIRRRERLEDLWSMEVDLCP